MKRITGNEKFWQTIKSNFTDKTLKAEKIHLLNEKILYQKKKMQLKDLRIILRKLPRLLIIDHPILSDLSGDPVLNAIENFSQHASVLKIRKER